MVRETGSLRERTLEQASDEALFDRYSRCGEEAAFVALMERHLPRIRRLLYGLLNGNQDDIQDVEQEVLAALWLELRNFRSDSSLSTYLYRLTKNKAIDFIRGQARQRRVTDAIGERCASPLEVYAAWDQDSDRRVAVELLLSRLAPEERLLITLRELEGLPIGEIAAILSVAEGTVKSRLHRIRRKIAAMAGGELP